jgi:hypothetical protein
MPIRPHNLDPNGVLAEIFNRIECLERQVETLNTGLRSQNDDPYADVTWAKPHAVSPGAVPHEMAVQYQGLKQAFDRAAKANGARPTKEEATKPTATSATSSSFVLKI